MLDINVFHAMDFRGDEERKKYFIFECLINQANKNEEDVTRLKKMLGFRVLIGILVIIGIIKKL